MEKESHILKNELQELPKMPRELIERLAVYNPCFIRTSIEGISMLSYTSPFIHFISNGRIILQLLLAEVLAKPNQERIEAIIGVKKLK